MVDCNGLILVLVEFHQKGSASKGAIPSSYFVFLLHHVGLGIQCVKEDCDVEEEEGG